MEQKKIPVNAKELEFLFKLLLNNSDYQDDDRNSLFQKVEKIYFESL